MTTWRGALVAGAGFGFAVATIAALTAATYVWYEARPRAWDSAAITATFAGVSSASNTPVGEALLFRYIVKNNTDADYRLDGGAAQLMVRLKDGGSLLHGSEMIGRLSIAYPLFIPARRRVKPTIFLSTAFSEQRPEAASPAYAAYQQRLLAYLKGDLPALGGFVLFDTARRYEITFHDDWAAPAKAGLQ
jgi:hypothetical protein